MIKSIFVSTLVALFFCSSLPAYALSSSDVEKFIHSMEELRPYFNEYEENLPDLDRDEDDLSSEGVKKAMLEPFAQSQEMSAIVKKHGFSSPEQWAETGSKISRAMMAIIVDEAVANADDYKAKIQADKNMTPEMAENLVAAMARSNQEFKEMLSDVSKTDIEVVTPYLSQLEEVLD